MIKLFQKIIKETLDKKQKKKLIFLLFINFFYILIEFLSISALIPFLVVILNSDPVTLDVGFFNNFLTSLNLNNLNITKVSLVIIVVFFLKSIISYFINFTNMKINADFNVHFSMKIYRKLLSSTYSKFTTFDSSNFINNSILTSQEFVNNFLIGSLLMLKSLFFSISLILFLALVNFKVTFSILLSMGLLIIIFFIMTRNKIFNYGLERVRLNKKIINLIQNATKGFKEIKLYSLGDNYYENQLNLKSRLEKIKVYQKMIALFPKIFLEFILILSILIIVYFYNYNSNLNNAAVVIGIFGYSSLRLLPQLLFIYKFFNKINYSKHSAQVIYDELKEISVTNEFYNQEPQIKFKFNKEIKFENISFRYATKKNDILNSINIIIEKNKTYGIKGESGSGKTTFSNILMGLLLPTNGKVYIDDNEIKLNSKFWRDKIALVPQDLVMFNDTIKKNIIFNSNGKVDEEYIYQLLKKVGLEKLIKNLPSGIDTKSGENGISLSIGERQRLGICRALYRKPEILILDEATSSLDFDNEKKFLEIIKSLKSTCTIIIISHKNTTLLDCDSILNLDTTS